MALCFSAYSNAQQIDTTGNLINNGNWSGVTYGYDPNDCCSNPGGSQPLYELNQGIIKWSYGTATVSQSIGIQNALSDAGTGLQVHGYNWSWWVRNDNGGTMQGGIDTLNYWINTTNSSGQLIDQMSGTYNTRFGPTHVSGTRTYASPYNVSELGGLTVSFSGNDGGFWAGLYGPEVGSVNISLNYSFDPCVSDPLYSSSCPGYLEAYMAQLTELLSYASASEPEVESIDYSLPTTASLSATPEETTAGEVKVDAGGIEVSTTGELSVPDGIPEEVKEKKPVDMNLISRIVREATDESATMSIVNQSIQDSMAEDANPDFSMTNETLASISRQTETSVQQSILENQEAAQSGITFSSNNSIIESTISSEFSVESSFETTEDRTVSSPTQTQSNNTDRVEITNENTKEITETVKKDVSPNEAAGDVSIDSIAQEPIGFNDYLAKNLQDMQFYKSEEIYKDSDTVDNRRALRLLSGASDRLHQEMINEQYRRR